MSDPSNASPQQLAILKQMGEQNVANIPAPQLGVPMSPWQVASGILSKSLGDYQLSQVGNLGNASAKNAIDTANPSGTVPPASTPTPQSGGIGSDLSAILSKIFGGGNSGNSDATAPQANGTPTQGGNNNAGGDNYAHKLIQIESGGDVNARSPGRGTYKGLGQFGPDEEAKYGLNDQNRNDPNAQLAAISQERQDINASFLKATGRLPTDGEAYLAHQQGMTGAPALVSNPNAPAYQVLSQFMKPEVAAQHIVANLPADSPLRNKPVGEITAGEFANLWTSKFDGQGNGGQNIQTGSNPTPPGQPTPATPNSPQPPPQIGQQGQQSTDNGPKIPVMPSLDNNQLYALTHQMDPDAAKAVLAEKERQYTGKTVDTGLGSYTQLPNGQRIFTPQYKINEAHYGNGISLPVATGLNPTTGKPESNYLVPGGTTPGQNNPSSPQNGQNTPQNNGVPSGGPDDIIKHYGALEGDVAAANDAKKAAATGIVKKNQDALSKTADTLNDAQTLGRNVQLLKSIEGSGDLDNVTTGPLADRFREAKTAVNNAFPGVVDQKSLAAADTYRKVSTLMASNLAKTLTNRPTQYDFKTFLNQAVPNFSTSPQARKSVLAIYDMQAQEAQAKAAIAQDTFQSGGTLKDYNTKMNEWYDQHPFNLEYNGKQYVIKGQKVGENDPKLLNEAQGEQKQQGQPHQAKDAKGNTYIESSDGRWLDKNGKEYGK